MIPTKDWALLIHTLFEIQFFCEHNFVIILLLFLSFIDKGLAMCRLGGGGGG